MTTNYHDAIATGAPANAATINAPLGQLDSAMTTLAASTTPLTDYVLSTGGPITQANGAASAAQKVVTVDSTTGFLGGCYVEYALATGVIERNTVATVDSATQLTLTMNIGAGGIANDALIAVIPVSLYNVQHTRLTAVYCFGDSLSTDGNYDTQLQTELGSTWAVRSAGISGNTTTQMAARLAADVTNAGDAAYVVVLGGINDVVQDEAAVDIEANLQTIYTALATAGAKVIAVTITPFKTHTYWTAGRQTVVDDVNTWILNTATDVDYTLDAYDLLEDGTSDTLAAAYDSGDHLHLSAAGDAALGTAIYGAAVWTASTTPVAVNLSGSSIGLNQSLLTTDDVTFANLHISDTLDMPIWKPVTDGTSALGVQSNAGNLIMTFDTTNMAVSIGQLYPDVDTMLYGLRRDTGSGNIYGYRFIGGKADATGSNSAYAIYVNTINYALTASSTTTNLVGANITLGLHAESGLTATATAGVGLRINTPTTASTGTCTFNANYGILIDDQGKTGVVTTSTALKIASQTGASAYAIYSEAGAHKIGSVTATLGFLGANPAAQLAHVTDASTAHAITEPGDAPADADALREDLVDNVIPSIETALNNLGTKINALFTMAETFGFHATS